MPIKYLKGDATRPQGGNHSLIIHVSNDMGGWGRKNGFTAAINNRWPENIQGIGSAPEFVFRVTSRCLGGVSFVPLPGGDRDLWVANMVAQHGYKSEANPVALDYTYLGRCLDQVNNFLSEMKALGMVFEVHCPKIGTGLAGGEWSLVENRLNVHISPEFTVNVYEL